MAERPPYTKMPSNALMLRSRDLVVLVAAKYGIPPAEVVSPLRTVRAVKARREAMRQMLVWGMTRSQLALVFNRDLRRVRASVIGEAQASDCWPPKKRRRR